MGLIKYRRVKTDDDTRATSRRIEEKIEIDCGEEVPSPPPLVTSLLPKRNEQKILLSPARLY
jgi:hypothetical protein